MLLCKGLKVALRIHPAQNKVFVKGLEEFLEKNNNPNLTIMRPKEVSLSEFFSFVDVLFASNSSIHLEAALADVITIYTNFGDYSIGKDYYGYVSKGISLESNGKIDVNFLDSVLSFSSSPARDRAIQEFSATYSTCWDGKEGELVAETINEIINGLALYGQFEKVNKSYCNFDIYKPKVK